MRWDFQPHTSDVDLLVVTSRRLEDGERQAVLRWGRGPLQVVWSTWDELPLLCNRPLGGVMAATLHRHGITVRGPAVAECVADVGGRTLRAQMRENVEAYWSRWLQRAKHRPLFRIACLHPRQIEWGVAGVPRQYVTLTEGSIVSKSAALRHVRERFDACWHRIIDEGLRLRAGAKGGAYATPFGRRRDMLAFLEYAIARTREIAG